MTRKVDNGVNVEALLGARAALMEAPEAANSRGGPRANGSTAPTVVRLSTGSLGSAKNSSTGARSRSTPDHPEVFASEDHGATPVELVLAGLASCLTAGVAAVAQNREIQLNSVTAKIEGGMDIQGILGADSDVRNGFSGIKVTYTIDADATPEEIRAVVAQSQKRSAVYDAITNPTNVSVEVN